MRAFGLGEALRRSGAECVYFLLEAWRETMDPRAELPVVWYKPEDLHQRLRETDCRAVLFEQWQPMTFLRKPLDVPVIVDLPGPLMLEYRYRDPDNWLQHLTDKLYCLSRADYALCALPRQRGYYAAWLSWAGFEPGDDRLAVTPFCMHEMPRSRGGHVEDEPLIFWGGVFWPWQDRFDAFRTIVETLESCGRGQLVVLGAEANDPALPPEYRAYSGHHHVTWLGRYAFTEYAAELKRAAVAVDLAAPTEERRLSSDLRTGTALWAGAPCVAAPESPWAESIQTHNAGWVVPYQDTRALSAIMTEVAMERGDIVARRRGAAEISKLISSEDRIGELLAILKAPTLREKRPPALDQRSADAEARLRAMRDEIDLLRHQNERLSHDLNSIRSNPLFKLYKNTLGRLR